MSQHAGPRASPTPPTSRSPTTWCAGWRALIDGTPGGNVGEPFNRPLTAHFVGGCTIGDSPQTGVVDAYQRMYGHEGLHVVDGSAVSANLGVNPSLTITAQAERAMAFWPNKGEADERPALGSAYIRGPAGGPPSARSSRRPPRARCGCPSWASAEVAEVSPAPGVTRPGRGRWQGDGLGSHAPSQWLGPSVQALSCRAWTIRAPTNLPPRSGP